MSSVTVQTPHPVPALDLPAPQKLSEKDQAEYDSVFAHFSNPDYVLPGVDAGKGSLMDVERMWLSYECILRFMRTTKHDTSVCIKRLEETLKWRREFGLYSFAVTPGETLKAEAATGSMFIYGYDPKGRPVIYYFPSRRSTKDDLQQIQFLFWTLDRAVELMGPGVESVTYMVDFENKGGHPTFYVTRQFLHIIQTHYPEHFGKVAYVHSPWLLTAFWDFTLPLMDTWSRSNITFDSVTDKDGIWRSASARDKGEPDALMVATDQLICDGLLGSVSFEHEHVIYWPSLVTMCEDRRSALTRVWQQLGGVVGIKEWDVRVAVRDQLATPVAIN